MTLEEVRVQIDAVDTQMKPLFMKRMECAKCVAEVKAVTGGDVFVPEREVAIIENRASDAAPEVYDEYTAFLRHLMSLSRRYQYGLLTEMQDQVIAEALNASGLDAESAHTQVKIAFRCEKERSNLNLCLNMAAVNNIQIAGMNVTAEDGIQKVSMLLDGSIKELNMRRLLCQIGKEAADFQIEALL